MLFEDLRLTFIAARRRWMAWRAPAVLPSALKAGERGAAVGVARAIERTMRGPFSDEPSLFHEIIRQESYKDARGQKLWRETMRDVTATPFELVGDDGSVVLVEPTIAVHTLAHVIITPTEGHRWQEARVAPDDRIVVYGLVDTTGAVDKSGYRTDVVTIPRIRGTIEEPLVISRAKKT